VGDGLEIYVVFAKGSRSLQSLANIRDVQEMTATEDGERIFVIRRELKKD
jgi:20S proteasome subunit beta 6